MKTKILSLVLLAFISGPLGSCSNTRRRSRSNADTDARQSISGSGQEVNIGSAENQPVIRRRSNSRGGSHQSNITIGAQEMETQPEEDSVNPVTQNQPAILGRSSLLGSQGGGYSQQPNIPLGLQETESHQDQIHSESTPSTHQQIPPAPSQA